MNNMRKKTPEEFDIFGVLGSNWDSNRVTYGVS